MSLDDLKQLKALPDRGWRVVAGFAGLALALPLGGCIQPLYGSLPKGGTLEAELQAIQVEPINDRMGHYLHDDLIFAFNGTGTHVPPKYKLIVTITEQVQTPLIDTVTGLASAANVTAFANFRLEPAAGGAILYKDTATVFLSYDRTTQRFADVRAAREAEITEAQRLADEIQVLVATAISKRNGV